MSSRSRILLGQHHAPQWDDFVADFQAIVNRSYYANNGPLVRELDARFGREHGGLQSVAMANATIATMGAARAAQMGEFVAVPATASRALLQGLALGLRQVVLLDVDETGENISVEALAAEDRPLGAVCVVCCPHASPPAALLAAARARGGLLVMDASRGLACDTILQPAADITIFDFSDERIIGAGQGAIVTTRHAETADRLRDVRSFHASCAASRVRPRINGKMAEAPAALILRGLAELNWRVGHNQALRLRYATELPAGLQLCNLSPKSSAAEVWVELDAAVDCSAEELSVRLAEVGIESGLLPDPQHQLARLGSHSATPANARFGQVERLRKRRLQLPIGGRMGPAEVARVCAGLNG